MADSDYIRTLDVSDLLEAGGIERIRFVEDANNPEYILYGLNVFENRRFHVLVPQGVGKNDRERWNVLRDSYDGFADLTEPVEVNGKSYAHRGRVSKFREIPDGVHAILPTFRGKDAEERARTMPLAVVWGNTISVFWTLNVSAASRELWRYVVSEAIKVVDWTEYDKRLTEGAKTRQVASALSEAMERASRDLGRMIEQQMRERDQTLASYIEKARQVEHLRAQQDGTDRRDERMRKDIGDFVAYLNHHPKIAEYGFEGGTLVLKTKDLKIKNVRDHEWYALPPLDVKLRLEDGDLRVGSPGKTGRQLHPHVYGDGRVCFGNFTTIYSKVMAAGQFRQAVDLTIEFLTSHNPASEANNPWSYLEKIEAPVSKAVPARRAVPA